MFNVGLGELAAIILVCALVFGPQRLPEMARQTGRLLGQLHLAVQDALDQVKQDADLQDADLPGLQVGSMRTQARGYLGRLLDIDGQMAELQQARTARKAELADLNNPEAERPTTATPHPDPPLVDPDATGAAVLAPPIRTVARGGGATRLAGHAAPTATEEQRREEAGLRAAPRL